MTNTPFNAKNGITANGGFTANSSMITLGNSVSINIGALSIGNSTTNAILSSNTLTINYSNGSFFVNYDQISAVNSALYIQSIGANSGLYLSALGSNTNVLGSLIVGGNTIVSSLNSNVIISSSINSVNLTANSIVSLTGISSVYNSNISSQGLYLQWNRNNGDNGTWLINQKGSGLGGINLGESDTNNNITLSATFTSNVATLSGNLSVNSISSNGQVTSKFLLIQSNAIATSQLYNSSAPGSNNSNSGRYFERYLDSNGLAVFRFVNGSYNYGMPFISVQSDINSNPNTMIINSNTISLNTNSLNVNCITVFNGSVYSSGNIASFNIFDRSNNGNQSIFYRANNITRLFDSAVGDVITYNNVGVVGIAGTLNVGTQLTAPTVPSTDNSINVATTQAVRNILTQIAANATGPSAGTFTIPGTGFIVKYNSNLTPSAGSLTWTFGTAFPNACVYADGIGSASTGNMIAFNISSISNSSVVLNTKQYNGSSLTNYNGSCWLFAIGY